MWISLSCRVTPGLLGDHVHHLVQRHGLHLLGGDVVGAAGAVDLDQGALGRDLEGLGHDGLHLEVEVQVDAPRPGPESRSREPTA